MTLWQVRTLVHQLALLAVLAIVHAQFDGGQVRHGGAALPNATSDPHVESVHQSCEENIPGRPLG
jgi:hypothetical protein